MIRNFKRNWFCLHINNFNIQEQQSPITRIRKEQQQQQQQNSNFNNYPNKSFRKVQLQIIHMISTGKTENVSLIKTIFELSCKSKTQETNLSQLIDEYTYSSSHISILDLFVYFSFYYIFSMLLDNLVSFTFYFSSCHFCVCIYLDNEFRLVTLLIPFDNFDLSNGIRTVYIY